MRACPGCGQRAVPSGQLCNACASLPKLPDVVLREWIDEGMLALERYLGCWAAFDAWLSVHPPA